MAAPAFPFLTVLSATTMSALAMVPAIGILVGATYLSFKAVDAIDGKLSKSKDNKFTDYSKGQVTVPVPTPESTYVRLC